MSPRLYRLGKRAEGVADTRRQILGGAADAYVDLGVRGTSMQEVARRADVAPATVLNHFGTPHKLAQAVVDDIIEDLALPEMTVFDDIPDVVDRIRMLIDELYDFYERSDRWFVMFTRERDTVPAFQEGERRVHETMRQLIVNALGDQSSDADLKTMVEAASHPALRQALLDVTGSPTDAKAKAQEIVEVWYETHRHAPT